MISVIIPCYSRQENLNKVIPAWLKQKGVEYELIVGFGPDVIVPEHRRIKAIPLDLPKGKRGALASWNNTLIDASDGDVLLFAHSDMLVRNPNHLAVMLAALTPNAMVTSNYIVGDVNVNGSWMQMTMISRELVLKAGKWDERYDEGAGWEDADFLTRLGKAGAYYEQVVQDFDKAPSHLPHKSCREEEWFMDAYIHNKTLYNNTHGAGILWNMEQGELNGKPFKR